MSQSTNRIANEIAEAVRSNPHLTDIQVREGSSIFIKGPGWSDQAQLRPSCEKGDYGVLQFPW
jgi:hypothetical protein